MLGPGIYHDLPNEEYHAQKHAISNSGLGDFAQSPAHYFARHLDPERPAEAEKAGQLEGTLAHCAVLEPEQFLQRYEPGPDVSRATKAWKDFAARCLADSILPIKSQQYEVAMKQAKAVHSLPDVAQALSRGRAEVSVFWEDEETGVLCRCRPDWVHDTESGGVILFDLKTYSDASPREFSRQVARKGYHRQAAMYSAGYQAATGVPVIGFVFVAVETSFPYAASAVMLDDESMARGDRDYRHLLRGYAECKAADNWPGYSAGIEMIRLPEWMLDMQ